MKRSNIISVLVGIAIGLTITYAYSIITKSKDSEELYFELMEDVSITDFGTLKRGVILKYDDSYPEGFTRYILYLNAKGIKTKKYKKTNDREIIPFWLDRNNKVID